MTTPVDFRNVSTTGLETSPHAEALAGLRANEARYFMTKYGVEFATSPASDAPEILDRIRAVLRERDIVIASPALEVAEMLVENIRWSFVFYESGLAINLLYHLDEAKRRAVGFKLSMGMDVPTELATKFKFARQKSKLAGEIRGSYFVVKGEYP